MCTLLLAACNAIVKEPELPDGVYVSNDTPEFITADLGDPATRTTAAWDDGTLSFSWKIGDTVNVCAACHSSAKMQYKATAAGHSAKFQRIGYNGWGASVYGIYYPASIASDIQYQNFDYRGQVQRKVDPMAHLSRYHAMRVLASDYSSIDFSTADQSSCMRFKLSGMTFHSPASITLSVYRYGRLHECFPLYNSLSSYYTDSSSSESLKDRRASSSISLALDGYGDEQIIRAFLSMPGENVSLMSGDVLEVSVQCSDETYASRLTLTSDMTLTAGHCHSFVRSSGWSVKQEGGDEGGDGPDLAPGDDGKRDYNTYSYDGQVVRLQQGTKSNLNIVLMGDGFMAEDFESGAYDAVMRRAYSSLFDVEPYSHFASEFSVYYVKAVSTQHVHAVRTGYNGAQNSDTGTRFGLSFSPNDTHVTGDYNTASTYSNAAVSGSAANNVVIVVIANLPCHAGTCQMYYSPNSSIDYGSGKSVICMAMGSDGEDLAGLVHHEVLGHGFGKLADEYGLDSRRYYSNYQSVWEDLAYSHSLGMYRNVDKYAEGVTTTSNVYWSDLFGTANDYENAEGLGIFEGAYTVCRDFCRPTEESSNSIMNGHSGFFNAICRRQILYRLWSLDGTISGKQWGTPAEVQRFLDWDAANVLPGLDSDPVPAMLEKREFVAPMSTPPVLHIGEWVDGEFVEQFCIPRCSPDIL